VTGPFVPLTGADCFLRAFDGEVRRLTGASHLSQLVLRLGPGFDPERLRAALAAAVADAPILRAPIRRPRPFAVPVYDLARAASAPPPRVEIAKDGGAARGPDGARAIPSLFFERLNETRGIARGELLRFDVVPYDGGAAGTDVAMTWLHMLFDGAGSEAFVRWLDERFRGAVAPGVLPAGDGLGELTPPPLGAGRGRQAQAWRAHMTGMAARPPRSLAGPARRVRQALRYGLATFTAEETAAIVARAKEKAGFLTPMLYYLAAAIRAHAAVFRARGVDPGTFVVPLPVNLRPKGGEGALFRTHVSMLWFHVPAETADDFDALLEALKTQRRESIKAGLVEAGIAAMDYARFAPARLYSYMARRTFGGELCSFFFAYTDHFLPGMTSFLGAPIENAFHAPSVPASPGSGAILSIREGCLNLTHVHQAGVLSDAERALLVARLRGDLLGRA
jgi:hypothetical protein